MCAEHSPSQAALTIDQARNKLLSAVPRCSQAESVAIEDAIGRVTAKNIYARINTPPFRNSAMDGYAIKHADFSNSREFKIAGVSLAGHPFKQTLANGYAVRVTTGAIVPADADTVVIQENTISSNSQLTITAAPQKGQHIRLPGDDINANDLLIAQHNLVQPAHAGLLAGQGFNEIEVLRKPRVGVFSTGDELCNPGESLSPGQIYDSNRIALCSMLQQVGTDVTDLGIVRDNRSAVEQALHDTDGFDFILSSGGVSVGEADFIKSALATTGELLFWKIAMKPGKPLVSARLKSGSLYFGLPGNPVSSLVTCTQFVIPAIRHFSNQIFTAPTTIKAVSLQTLNKEIGRYEFQRGIAKTTEDGRYEVESTGLQDSHVLSSMTRANCFICLGQFENGAAAGSEVDILLFNDIDGLKQAVPY